MRRVALYIRVSTARQDLEGYSIPLQKERLLAFCKAKGWVVVKIFVDPGHSGSSLDRPGIDALMQAANDRLFDVVLVYKLDRLSRSQKDTLHLIEDIFMANGIDFVSMQESFDTSTIYGRAMVGILSVFAQMERETITERTLMGRSGRAEEGLWHGGGTDPIGYEYVDGELVVNEKEAEQVRMVYALYAEGYTVTEITRRMDGYTTKHGDWSHTSTVGNVLDNPLYAGTVHFDGVEKKGIHTPIVSQEIDFIVKARRERQHFADARSLESDFLLTGLIYCQSCGARYFAHKRPNGSIVYSCHSRAKKNKRMIKDPNCKAPHFRLSELDDAIEAEVLRLAADLSLVDELIEQEKRAAMAGDSDAHDTKSDELRKIDSEIGRLMDLYQYSDLIAVEEIAERLEKLHAERVLISPRQQVETRTYTADNAKRTLRDVGYSWGIMTVREKRLLLMQLIDRINLDDGGIGRIEWSFI